MVVRQLRQVTHSVSARYASAVERARRRSPQFDHFWRAKQRYSDVLAGRLAAAIAYYGFFATFALGMLTYGILITIFSSNAQLVQEADDFLSQYFTTLNTGDLKDAAGVVGVTGLVSLIFAGIGWADAWRSSQRAMWKLDQHPGNFLALRAVDLATLIVFGILVGASLTAIDLLESILRWLSGGTSSIWLTAASYGLTVLVNMVVGFALTTIVPRLHLTRRRLLPPVLMIGTGLTLLNSLGRYFVQRTENNPAYAVVTTAVGILVYLYLFNQVVLWAVAFAATSTKGRVFDLAWGRPREHGAGPDRATDHDRDTDGAS